MYAVPLWQGKLSSHTQMRGCKQLGNNPHKLFLKKIWWRVESVVLSIMNQRIPWHRQHSTVRMDGDTSWYILSPRYPGQHRPGFCFVSQHDMTQGRTFPIHKTRVKWMLTCNWLPLAVNGSIYVTGMWLNTNPGLHTCTSEANSFYQDILIAQRGSLCPLSSPAPMTQQHNRSAVSLITHDTFRTQGWH